MAYATLTFVTTSAGYFAHPPAHIWVGCRLLLRFRRKNICILVRTVADDKNTTTITTTTSYSLLTLSMNEVLSSSFCYMEVAFDMDSPRTQPHIKKYLENCSRRPPGHDIYMAVISSIHDEGIRQTNLQLSQPTFSRTDQDIDRKQCRKIFKKSLSATATMTGMI